MKIAGPVATPTPTPVPSPFPRPVRALNDTGITRCADATARDLPCPVPGLPGQDAEFGRDVTHPDDRDGHAGFSYSKIAADGSTLPLVASHWVCVKDNVTGLIWEEKTADGGLRDGHRTYSHYSVDFNPVGLYGTAGDASGFVAAVNAEGLCGARDWRLPNRNELVSLLDYGKPAGERVDQTAFPGDADGYWSASPGGDEAWNVNFYDGYVGPYNFRYGVYAIRLVRDGP